MPAQAAAAILRRKNVNKELTIDILSSVAKPARYTGDEFGSIVKTPEETEVSIALAGCVRNWYELFGL